MSVKELKQEIINYVDELSYNKMVAIYGLLSAMSEDYWQPVIETDLTDEEREIIASSANEYKEHPENFIDLDEYINSRKLI
jgi:hypothetical protein